MVMNIKAMEFDNNGKLVKVKGTFTKDKVWSNKNTYKIKNWAELGLDYIGG